MVNTQYVNIWSITGLLGAPPRMHSSRVYASAREAVIGRDIEPDAGYALLGTLDLRPGHDQPKFVNFDTLQARADAEREAAAA